jgi:hypothetical protein
MNIQILANEDENFKIQVKEFGEQFVAFDGERSVIAKTEEEAVEGVKEIQQQNVEVQRGPKPAPIENPKSSGLSWFSGTSWDTKQ